MSSPRTGSILGGRYRLVRPLASGGMGAVWIAHHIDLEVDVAVKLIEGEGTRRPELLERFRREARAAAQLKTPHVVQILDFGVDGETPYIAMELLQGSDLDAHLAERGTLAPTRALGILRPLCKALEVAHGAGIVHRDLKPANVFLALIGGDEVVKIVDFGIAKELNRGGEWTTGTAMMGSPLFMSPEQIRGSGHVDARTDVWALGVIAYLMLFGEPPFHGDGLPAIFYNIAHGPFDAPSTRSPALVPLDAFFARALARDVGQRYQTVGDLLAGFEQAVRQLPDPSLAVQRSGRVSRDGTLASASDQASPGMPHVASGATPSAHRPFAPSAPPPAVEVRSGGDGTVSAFDSSPRPGAPPGPLARAKSTTSSGKPASALPLVLGGVATVLAVIGFVVFQAGGGDPPSGASAAPAALAASDAPPATGPAVQPAAASTPAAADAAPIAPPSAASTPSAPLATASASGAARAPSSKAPAGKSPTGKPAPSAPAPTAPARSSPAKQTTVDPEWGVPVQR